MSFNKMDPKTYQERIAEAEMRNQKIIAEIWNRRLDPLDEDMKEEEEEEEK